MFNPLKNNFGSKSTIETRPIKEVIQEIHDTFYSEVDRLLAEAKISKSLDTDKQALIDKCKRLEKLGFTNTKEVKEAKIEIYRLENLKYENSKKADLIEAINYFSVKYPNYKFITEESVKKICEKYNLVYGEINKYIGTVPDVNLKQIEEFKINDEDKCCEEIQRSMYFSDSHRKYLSLQQWNIQNEKELKDFPRMYYGGVWEVTQECPLEIAAPLSDFNMTDAEVKNFKISNIHIPDPVVLQPVIFKGVKHFLICTCWGGPESTDELVVNNKMN